MKTEPMPAPIAADPIAAAESELSLAKFAYLKAESAADKARRALVSAEVDVKTARIRVDQAEIKADAALAAKYAGRRYYLNATYRAGGGCGGPDWSEDTQSLPSILRRWRANSEYETVVLITEARTASGRWGAREVETFEIPAAAA